MHRQIIIFYYNQSGTNEIYISVLHKRNNNILFIAIKILFYHNKFFKYLNKLYDQSNNTYINKFKMYAERYHRLKKEISKSFRQSDIS